MGTRNITRVKIGGKLKACQYGQWDGYPTAAGLHVLEFVRSADMGAFAEKAASCTLENTSGSGAEVYYTGAPATDGVRELFEEYGRRLYGTPAKAGCDYGKRLESVHRGLARKFGAGRYAEFLAASRDTGYRILDAILELGPMELYCDDYLLMDECDWQIEAINEVDLDARRVRMNFHNHVREYGFDELAGMDVEAEMEAFEAEVYGPDPGEGPDIVCEPAGETCLGLGTPLGFRAEAREFVESAEQVREIGGKVFLKAGSAGLPGDLEGRVLLLLSLDGGDAAAESGEGARWRTACAYDAETLLPVEAYSYAARSCLIDPAGADDTWTLPYGRSDEIGRVCESAREEAAERAWERALGRSDMEADLEAVFGGRQREPLATRGDLERWYLAHGTLERDFSEELRAPRVEGARRLRALYRRDGLVEQLAGSFGERELARLRLLAAEWSAIASAEGESIAGECAGNAAILEALGASGAKTVKMVFDEDGGLAERPVRADCLAREARSGPGLSLSGWVFTPQLEQAPDMSSFVGIKFRGKWIYRVV